MLLTADQGPPTFAAAGPIVAAAMADVRYPPRVAISQAAHDIRVLVNPGAFTGPWRESPHDMSFTVRAMDGLGQESPYRDVVIEGPAQTGKSEIGNNWQMHTVVHDQADMMFVMPDKISIEQYVKTQWDKMTENIPEVAARLLPGSGADTIHLKRFRGCEFFFLWPGGPTFRARPISRGRLDDYDDIAQNVGAGAGGKGGQGDPLSLMLGRSGSFSAYGGAKIYVNSTPKLGPKRGIEALRVAGTNELLYWDCLHCDEPFEVDTEAVLDFDRNGSPTEAAATAVVVCPGCGACHSQADKAALIRTERWVGRGETAVSRTEVAAGKTGELLPNRRLSQRWDGLRGFRLWSDMAEQWRTAELAYENGQDEGPLTTFYQTVIGKNYTAKGSGEPTVTEDELLARARLSTHRFGEFPPEARCLVMAVDQAVNRFEVAAWAFGPGFRAWLVDRFSIVNHGDEPLKPFTRADHFAVLHARVLSKTYPVRGAPDLRVKPFGTVLDTGGMDDATDNAFAWWHSMVAGDVGSGRRPVPATAITLFKGGNKPNGKLLPPPTIDAKRQIKGAATCELYIPNVHRIKDMADVGLRRKDGGPGSIDFPGDVDAHGELLAGKAIAEMRAEHKEDGLWVRPQGVPNETGDLYVMARTVLLRFGGHDHSLDWVPTWARPPRQVAIVTPAQRQDAAEQSAHAETLREEQRAENPAVERPEAMQTSIVQRANSVRLQAGRTRVRVVRTR